MSAELELCGLGNALIDALIQIDDTEILAREGLDRGTMHLVDHERWEPTPDRQSFSGDFTDRAPIQGENRYYLRVEQADGNMAWTSPCWVTVVGDTP